MPANSIHPASVTMNPLQFVQGRLDVLRSDMESFEKSTCPKTREAFAAHAFQCVSYGLETLRGKYFAYTADTDIAAHARIDPEPVPGVAEETLYLLKSWDIVAEFAEHHGLAIAPFARK